MAQASRTGDPSGYRLRRQGMETGVFAGRSREGSCLSGSELRGRVSRTEVWLPASRAEPGPPWGLQLVPLRQPRPSWVLLAP